MWRERLRASLFLTAFAWREKLAGTTAVGACLRGVSRPKTRRAAWALLFYRPRLGVVTAAARDAAPLASAPALRLRVGA